MKIVNTEIISDLLLRAAGSPRKRMNHNLHTELIDPINRFVNAGIAGTYIRPTSTSHREMGTGERATRWGGLGTVHRERNSKKSTGYWFREILR